MNSWRVVLTVSHTCNSVCQSVSTPPPVAVERLSGIAASPTAWQPAYVTMKEADDTMVPECPEGLMQLIAGITGGPFLMAYPLCACSQPLTPIPTCTHTHTRTHTCTHTHIHTHTHTHMHTHTHTRMLHTHTCTHTHTRTDRYKHLSSVDHHLRFLELQIDLLLEFHHDLANNARRASHSPLHPQFCAYLNAASYIVAILREWGEQMVSPLTSFISGNPHVTRKHPFIASSAII